MLTILLYLFHSRGRRADSGGAGPGPYGLYGHYRLADFSGDDGLSGREIFQL